MPATADKKNIEETFDNISSFSYKEKKGAFDEEEKVNKLLDSILTFKNEVKGKGDKIEEINKELEKLTWIEGDLDGESEKLLNDLISAGRDLIRSMKRKYASWNAAFRKKGIAKEELNHFKETLDDLEESIDDVESIFFTLPTLDEFKEANNKLSGTAL